MLNNSEKNEINWNNIFTLKEFIDCIYEDSLTEFSLTSKFTRYKLRSKLFNKSYLTGETYHNYFKNGIIEYENRLCFSSSSFRESMWNSEDFRDELNEQLTKEADLLTLSDILMSDLQGIRSLIKSIKFEDFGHCFYILYPVTLCLYNLTQLEIRNCTLPLLSLLRIGEYLKKLKKLTLHFVGLVELSKQELSSDEIYFPNTLEELSIDYFYLMTLSLRPNVRSPIRNRQDQKYIETNRFNGLKILNLKRLCFGYINSNYIQMLLISNPKVNEIKILDKNFGQIVYDKLSTMVNLTKLIVTFANQVFPHITNDVDLIIPQFNFIKELTLEFYYVEQPGYIETRSITGYFPNLTKLTINLGFISTEDFNFSNFLRVNLPITHKLEVLVLEDLECQDEYNFYWLKYITVNCLILNDGYIAPTEINFNHFSKHLKQFIKFSDDVKYDLDDISDNQQMFKNWNITVKGSYIHFKNKTSEE